MVSLYRSEFLVLLIVCLSCVVFQATSHQVGFYGAETDLYLYYARTAQALHHGAIWIDDFHPPLYGWLLGILALTPSSPAHSRRGFFCPCFRIWP